MHIYNQGKKFFTLGMSENFIDTLFMDTAEISKDQIAIKTGKLVNRNFLK